MFVSSNSGYQTAVIKVTVFFSCSAKQFGRYVIMFQRNMFHTFFTLKIGSSKQRYVHAKLYTIKSQNTNLVGGLEYRSVSLSVVSLFSPSVSQSEMLLPYAVLLFISCFPMCVTASTSETTLISEIV